MPLDGAGSKKMNRRKDRKNKGWLDIKTLEAAQEAARMEEAPLEVIRLNEAFVPKIRPLDDGK